MSSSTPSCSPQLPRRKSWPIAGAGSTTPSGRIRPSRGVRPWRQLNRELQHDHTHPLSSGLDRQRGSRQHQYRYWYQLDRGATRHGVQQTHRCGDAHSLTAQPLMAPHGVNLRHDTLRLDKSPANPLRMRTRNKLWGNIVSMIIIGIRFPSPVVVIALRAVQNQPPFGNLGHSLLLANSGLAGVG